MSRRKRHIPDEPFTEGPDKGGLNLAPTQPRPPAPSPQLPIRSDRYRVVWYGVAEVEAALNGLSNWRLVAPVPWFQDGQAGFMVFLENVPPS